MAYAIVGVCDFVYQEQGWSERYFLGSPQVGGSLVSFLPILQQIVYGRSALYGAGVNCIFARVSMTDSSHDGLLCQLPYPVGPHPSWNSSPSATGPDALGPPNDPETVIQQRFETNTGKFWQRYYRCMPDNWVTNKINQYPTYWQAPNNGLVAGDMGPTGGLSHFQVCQSFWQYLINFTYYAHPTGSGNYTLAQFQYIVMRQVTSRKIGRPFGMSRGRRPKTLITN